MLYSVANSGHMNLVLRMTQLVLYECNLKELLGKANKELSAVAQAAQIERTLLIHISEGRSNLFKQKEGTLRAEREAGLEPRIVRLAKALGVEVSAITCEKLLVPREFVKVGRKVRVIERREKVELTAVKPIKLPKADSFTLKFPLRHIFEALRAESTLLEQLETESTPDGFNTEDFVFITTIVSEVERQVEIRNSTRPLNLMETKVIVHDALKILIKRRKGRKKKTAPAHPDLGLATSPST